jgi:hypothetical protein
MGFNSAFKGLIVKNPGNGRLNNLNDPVLNVLTLRGEYAYANDFKVMLRALTGFAKD